MPAELPPMGPALAEGFAEAMAGLVSGLAVVTAGGPDGRPRGLLVSSLCSYSMRPPSLLMSVNRATRSYAALLSSAEFGVHLLGRDQDLLAGVFCSRREDKFADVPWRWTGAVPRLDGVVAFLHCVTAQVFQHGDHAIVIGEVADLRLTDGEPLVQYRRQRDWRVSPATLALSPRIG